MQHFTLSIRSLTASMLLIAVIMQCNGCKTDSTTSAISNSKTINLTFVTYRQANLALQDVFLPSLTSPDSVLGADANTSVNVFTFSAYSTKNATPHDPYEVGPKPLGPFQAGHDLGFTMNEWLRATGSGTYIYDSTNSNVSSELALIFSNLRPSATYSVWCSRITTPPSAYSVVDAPCGKTDGSENVFHTDASGNGVYNRTLATALAKTSGNTHTIISIIYHSDGMSHGVSPGDYGKDSHIQVFNMFTAY